MCPINFKVTSSVNVLNITLEPIISLHLSKWKTGEREILEKNILAHMQSLNFFAFFTGPRDNTPVVDIGASVNT